MRKPTKAEQNAVETLKRYAADYRLHGAAWQAVWDVAMDKGFWEPETRILWFALLNTVSHERRLIACGLAGQITEDEVKYRYGLGPKPADEAADAKQVAFNRATGRAKFLDELGSDLRKLKPQVVHVFNELVRLIDHTEPIEPV